LETILSASLAGFLTVAAITGTTVSLVTEIIILVLLIVASAFISGAEVAFF